ncbi:MAG: phosphate--acyl-ACP acyltransferase [Firmicutes bacterium HGW-Firmicutes-12]|jgi:glycerol-3-phosphate acyltransferase PlsX|nr:MAG: phosphate--acyl-ACP acyltransferase [Firmicutes bacterium HGW-Firmicutes-12]
MRIAIDAMGGDHAPDEIIKGSLAALEENKDLHIILVGKEAIIKPLVPLDLLAGNNARIAIHNCEEVIGMNEHPATAYRRKKDASITIATKLVKEKKADAVVSAGSTGAQMVTGLFGLGRLKGVDRPAIVIALPTLNGPKVMLDVGANADCKPENLVQFAQMGSRYAQEIMGIKKPQVGLVNIGEEETKGNELTIKTYELLKENKRIDFKGNIEGRDILAGKADVMVCDGFVGNIILKVIEGTAGTLFSLLKEEFTRDLKSKTAAFFLKPGLKKLKGRLDYAEYGGAPLLGVNGVSIICHGSSKAAAIKNAIRVAQDCVRNNFVQSLQDSIKE